MKSIYVHVAVTPEIVEKIKIESAPLGLSVSAFVRDLVFQHFWERNECKNDS